MTPPPATPSQNVPSRPSAAGRFIWYEFQPALSATVSITVQVLPSYSAMRLKLPSLYAGAPDQPEWAFVHMVINFPSASRLIKIGR